VILGYYYKEFYYNALVSIITKIKYHSEINTLFKGTTMAEKEFLKRADAHIHLANDQISQELSPGEVSSSFMYGAARFNAWVAACEFESAEAMAEAKGEVVDYFVDKYKTVLEEHLKNHIETFDFSK